MYCKAIYFIIYKYYYLQALFIMMSSSYRIIYGICIFFQLGVTSSFTEVQFLETDSQWEQSHIKIKTILPHLFNI